MKKLCFLLLFVSLASPIMAADIAGYNSFYKDTSYRVGVLEERIEAAPKWEEKDQNPPLSARKAQSLGAQAIKDLFPDTNAGWRLHSISLDTLYKDGWIYCLEFSERLPEGKKFGTTGTMRIIIYMDGTVAKPDLSKPDEH